MAYTNRALPSHSVRSRASAVIGARLVSFVDTHGVAACGSFFAAALLASTALPVHADEVSDLRQQIKTMKAAAASVEKRLNRLEREKAVKAVPAPVVATFVPPPGSGLAVGPVPSLVTSRYPGYIDIPGTDTSVKIGGYFKVDGVYDIHGGGIGGVASDFAEIYLKGQPRANRAGDFNATVRQSQISVATITPTSEFGDLKTFISFDFYGGTNGNGIYSNSYAPRVYLAYASMEHALGGSLMVGDNWSTFMDLDSYPETLDFNGPVGVAFIRQPQVRYTRNLGGGSMLLVSAEAAYADFEGANPYPVYTAGGAASTNIINPIPDFVAKYTYDASWGHLALAGVARYVKANTGGATVSGLSGQTGVFGGGFMGGLVVKTIGADTINVQGVGGPGVGRYLYGEDDSGGSAASLTYCGTNVVACGLRATTAYGATASYQHYWTDKVRSNFVGGFAHYNNEFPDNPSGSVNTLYSAFANIIYSPVPHTDIGLEFIYGKKVVDASPGAGIGTEGEAYRVLGSVKVGF